MPQLMPLPWILSSLMVFLLVLVFINMYYIKFMYLYNMKYGNSYFYNFKMEW